MFPTPKLSRDIYQQTRDMARRFADAAIRPIAEELDRNEECSHRSACTEQCPPERFNGSFH